MLVETIVRLAIILAIIAGAGYMIYLRVDFLKDRKVRKKLCSEKVQATIVDFHYEAGYVEHGQRYYAIYLFYYDNRKYCVKSENVWYGLKFKDKKVTLKINPHNPTMIYDEDVVRSKGVVGFLCWMLFIFIVAMISKYLYNNI